MNDDDNMFMDILGPELQLGAFESTLDLLKYNGQASPGGDASSLHLGYDQDMPVMLKSMNYDHQMAPDLSA